MDKFYLISYIVTAIVNILIIVWWRCSCEWTEENSKFPTRGHVLLLSLLSLCPFANFGVFAILLGLYIGLRLTGEIKLKKNKFNQYWFDIK